jgi:hypothetical protein
MKKETRPAVLFAEEKALMLFAATNKVPSFCLARVRKQK